jgi:uncharacterized protein YkwD
MSKRRKARKIASTVHRYVNNQRNRRDKKPLAGNKRLASNAEDYARTMANRDRISHTLGGENPSQRAVRFAGVTENNVKTYWAHRAPSKVASQAVNQFMNSGPHRANLLSSDLSHSGVGVWIKNNNAYICHMFAKRRGVVQAAKSFVESVG